MNSTADYRITASQLNSFDWFLKDEKESAEQDLLDTINRVPKDYAKADKKEREKIEKMAKGKCFEYVINQFLLDNNIIAKLNANTGACPRVKVDFSENNVCFNFDFDVDLVVRMHNLLVHQKVHSLQVFISKYITLASNKLIELYGYVDYLTPLTIIDLKTTSDYNFPKYLTNWQTYVYGYILADRIGSVDFIATDFEHIYHEIYNIEHINYYEYKLKNFLQLFIEWLEKNKNKITDKKIFGLENDITRSPEAIITVDFGGADARKKVS